MVYLTFVNKLDIPVFNSIVTIILSNPWIRFIFRIFKWRKWMLLTSMWLISVIYHKHYILLHLYYGIAFSGNQRQYIKQRLQFKANAGNTWHSTGQFLNMFQHVLFVFFMEIGSSKRTPFTNIMCQAGSQTKHVKALYGQIMILYDQLRHTCTCLVQSMTLYDQNQNILCRNYDFTSLYAKTTIFYGQTTAL